MLKVYSIRNFYSSTEFNILITEEELDTHREFVENYVAQDSNWNSEWGTPKGFYAVELEDATINPQVSISYNKDFKRYNWEFKLEIWIPQKDPRYSLIACGYNTDYIEAAEEAQRELNSWMNQFDWR